MGERVGQREYFFMTISLLLDSTLPGYDPGEGFPGSESKIKYSSHTTPTVLALSYGP